MVGFTLCASNGYAQASRPASRPNVTISHKKTTLEPIATAPVATKKEIKPASTTPILVASPAPSRGSSKSSSISDSNFAEKYFNAAEIQSSFNFKITKGPRGLIASYLIPKSCHVIFDGENSFDYQLSATKKTTPIQIGILFRVKDNADKRLVEKCSKANLYKTCTKYHDALIASEKLGSNQRWKIIRLEKTKAIKGTEDCDVVSEVIPVDFESVAPAKQEALIGVAVPGADNLIFDSARTLKYRSETNHRIAKIDQQIATQCGANPTESGLRSLERFLDQTMAQSNLTNNDENSRAVIARVAQGKNKINSTRQKISIAKKAAEREALLKPLDEDDKISSHSSLLRKLDRLANQQPETREDVAKKEKAIFEKWISSADADDIEGDSGLLDRLLTYLGRSATQKSISKLDAQRLVHKAIKKIDDAEELETALERIIDSNWGADLEEKREKDFIKTVKYIADRAEKKTQGSSQQKAKARSAILDKAIESNQSNGLKALKIELQAKELANKVAFDGPLGKSFMQSMMGGMGMMGGLGGMGMMGGLGMGNPMMMMGFNSMLGMTRMELQMKSYQYLMGRMSYCGGNFSQFGVSAPNTNANQTLCGAYTQGYQQITQGFTALDMYDSMKANLLAGGTAGGFATTGQMLGNPNAALLGGNQSPRAFNQQRGRRQQQTRTTAGQNQPQTTIDINAGGRRRVRVPNPSSAQIRR